MSAPLPTLVVIGAMKCGTRSLYEYLRAHPDVFMSTTKELNYFGDDAVYAHGQDWYTSHFASSESVGAAARGEASPRYTMPDASPHTAARMCELVPHARLLFLVRNPIDRIESHYHHRVRKTEPLLPIDEEVLADPVYVDTSAYATRLEPFLDRFPREQVLVVTSDALRKDRAATMRSVYEFVEVDPTVHPDALAHEFTRAADRRVARGPLRRFRHNRLVAPVVARLPRSVRERVGGVTGVASNTSHLAPDTRAILAERLADAVRRLQPLMPPGFDGWGIS